MRAVILPIGAEAVVDGTPPEGWQAPNRLGGGGAALVVTGVVGQLRRGSRVQPHSFARDIHPSLIEVDHLRMGKALLDGCFGLRQCYGASVDGRLQQPSETGCANRSATISQLRAYGSRWPWLRYVSRRLTPAP